MFKAWRILVGLAVSVACVASPLVAHSDTSPVIGQAAVAPSAPMTWSTTVTEYSSWTLEQPQVVRYGSGSRWVTKTLVGPVKCTNEFFGTDPLVGTVKHCEVGWWRIAAEAASFLLVSKNLVRYGADSRWVYGTFNTGHCAAASFGRDPAPGTAKHCEAAATIEQTIAPQMLAAARTKEYDYTPTIMQDGVYRMWWCTPDPAHFGDAIGFSQAPTMTGPWSTPRSVFQGTSPVKGRFDTRHACDPSVLRVGSRTYLYYGGRNVEDQPDWTTALGVASSSDSLTWRRENNGQPIISALIPSRRKLQAAGCSPYGAGQPSAVYLKGYIYLAYTDTTRKCAGGGVYLVRSTDPLFGKNVQKLTASGFVPLNSPQDYRPIDLGASIDLAYSDALDRFVLFSNQALTPGMTVTLLDPNTWKVTGTHQFAAVGSRRDGPGVAKRPDGHLPVDAADPTGAPLATVIATGPETPSTWDLALSGAKIPSNLSIEGLRASGRVPGLLEGYALPVAGNRTSVVTGGKQVQFDVPAAASKLTANTFTAPAAWVGAVPVAATIARGQRAVKIPGQPGGFLAATPTGTMFLPVSCPEILAANGSRTETVSTTTYRAYRRGPSLYCRSA